MSLFFQAKGELKKEIAACLRQGRAVRKPRNQRIARQRFSDPMVMISERPATVNDRAVPGQWEGDLILGKENKSAIGTLVERSTRYVMLLHLPNGLLRQYFPKGTDLSVHTKEDLEFVAMQLNDRPRATLDFAKPAEKMAELLSHATEI